MENSNSVRLRCLPRKFPDQQWFPLELVGAPNALLMETFEKAKNALPGGAVKAPPKWHVTFAFGPCVVKNWEEIERAIAFEGVEEEERRREYPATFGELVVKDYSHADDGVTTRVAYVDVACPELAAEYKRLKTAEIVEDWKDYVYRTDGSPPFHIAFVTQQL